MKTDRGEPDPLHPCFCLYPRASALKSASSACHCLRGPPMSAPDFSADETRIRQGGGPKAIDRQHEKGRLTARERIAKLVDDRAFFELGLWAAWNMYAEWGGA